MIPNHGAPGSRVSAGGGEATSGTWPCPTPVTVIVAVQKSQVREALVAMIDDLEGFQVVGQAATDLETLELARALRPCVVVVDEELPDCRGTWTIQTLASQHLARAVVATGLRGCGATRARAAGAHGYVQTGASPADLVAALRAAAVASRANSPESSPRGAAGAPLARFGALTLQVVRA